MAKLASGTWCHRYPIPTLPSSRLVIGYPIVIGCHRSPNIPGLHLTPPWVYIHSKHVTRLSFQVPAVFLAAPIRIAFPDTSVEMTFVRMVDFPNNNNKKKKNKSQSPWTTRTIITNRWRHPWPKQSTCTTLNWPSTFPQFVLNNLG
jgi:hypothetical protein